MVFTTKLHQEAATRWSRHSCQAMSKIIRLLRGILLRRRFRRCWEGPFLVCLGKEDTIKCFWGGMRSEILPNLTYQIQTRFLGRIYDKSTQPLVFWSFFLSTETTLLGTQEIPFSAGTFWADIFSERPVKTWDMFSPSLEGFSCSLRPKHAFLRRGALINLP